MTLGLIMYFYYGITHSSLENPTEEIELTVDTSYLNAQPKQQQPKENNEPTAVWDRHGYENKMADEDWSTSQNNYTANSWDINDVNKSWNNSNSNNFTSRQPPPPPANKPKPTQALRPSPLPSSQQQQQQQHRQQPQPSSAAQQNPKGGFGHIFVDESQFPKWED